MADFTIDTLNIQIDATANTAMSTVDKLMGKVNKLESAVSQLKRTSAKLTAISSAFKSVDKATATTAKNLANVQLSLDKMSVSTAKSSAAIQTAQAKLAATTETLNQRMRREEERTSALKRKNVLLEEETAQRVAKQTANAKAASIRAEMLQEKRATTRSNTGQDSSKVDKLTKSYENLGSAWGRIKQIGIVYVFQQIGETIGSLVTKSNSYIENMNLFMVQMQGFEDEATEFIDKLESVLGVDPSSAMRYMGFFMQISSSIGMASDAAFQLSKNFTLLGYDLSSFLNIPIEEAMIKLRSGLTGETEPLQAVGYAIKENSLQQTLNEAITRKQYDVLVQQNEALKDNSMIAILNDQYVGKRVRDLTEAQKVELRYVTVMNQATKAMTDMSQTLSTPANQMRILRQQIEMTGRSLGNIFIPILNKVLPLLIAFARVVREVADMLANLFGFELPEIDWNRDFTTGATSAADAVEDIGENGKKAAKDLKNLLAPFDELNILDKSSASTGSTEEETTGGGGALFDQLPDYTSILDSAIGQNVDNLTDKMRDLLALIGAVGAGLLAWKVADALLSNMDTIKAKAKDIKEVLSGKDLKNTIIEKAKELPTIFATASKQAALFGGVVALMVWRIYDLYTNSELFRKGLERVSEVLDIISDAVDTIAGAIYENLIEPLSQIASIVLPDFIVDFFKGLAEWLSNLGIDFGDFLITFGGIALIATKISSPLGMLLLGFEAVTFAIRALGSVTDEQMAAFKATVENVVVSVVAVLERINEGMEEAASIVEEQVGEIIDWFEKLPDKVDAFIEKVKEIPNTVRTGLTDAYNIISEQFTNMVNIAATKWDEFVNTIKTKLIEFLTASGESQTENAKQWDENWEKIKEVFKTKWKEITTRWKQDIKTWWDNDVAPWFTKERWLESLKGMVDAIQQSFRNAISGATTLINRFIDGVNDRMRFQWDDVEIAGETVFSGGMIQLFTIPHVPQLFADGGFPTVGDMFIANEAGAEMVGSINGRTAVVNNDQIVAAVSKGVYAAVVSAMSEQSSQPIVVELDGEVIYNNQRKVERTRGVSNFNMGAFVR